jgi:predicted nucleic acid-binding protein
MATTNSGVIADANTLVYVSLAQSPFHAAAAAKLNAAAAAGVVWTSRQVLREFVATMTRPGVADPMPALTDVVRAAQAFERQFRVAEDNAAVTAELLSLLQIGVCGGKQVHDANIVATMRAYGIGTVRTQNLKDFHRFAHLVAVVPLVP